VGGAQRDDESTFGEQTGYSVLRHVMEVLQKENLVATR